MEITKTIKLTINKKGKYIVCDDLNTLSLILGSKSVVGNLDFYKVIKKDNMYFVPIDVVKERIEVLEGRIKKMESCLEVMRQLVK